MLGAMGANTLHRGTSWLHRLHPISKLAWVFGVVLFAFASYSPFPLFGIAVLGLALGFTAGIGVSLLRVLVALAPLTASMLVIQTLAPATCSTTCTAAAQFGPLTLYREGMAHGLSLVARVLAMEVVALGALMTIHPSGLFAAFARLRVPFVLNFMVSLTLQLVPVFRREVSIVLAAQRSRGMRGRGFGAVVPAFVPVFAGAFERVRQLSISLESRAFGSSGPRTSFREVRLGPVDAVVAVLGLAAGVIGIVLGLTLWSVGQAPILVLAPALTVALFLVAALVFVGVLGAAVLALLRA